MKSVDNPKKVVKEGVEIVDIAGLVRGASNGEGLGNQFLAHIREVDMIINVVRAFKDDSIIHVEGRVNPIDDIEIIKLELRLKDLETVNKRIEKIQKDISKKKEYSLMCKIVNLLNKDTDLNKVEFEEDEKKIINEMQLLSCKPALYICNVDENFSMDENIKKYFQEEDVVYVPVKLMKDLKDFGEEEIENLCDDFETYKNKLNELAKKILIKLGLITFFTSGPDESRAWMIKKGINAPQAAGKIHSDFEKKFIKAEICDLDYYCDCIEKKEKPNFKLEGKGYIMQDGDVVFFRIGK